ncbi:hypothetical protein JCM5350_004013 [Sporobolomyces pararoseus]
MQALEAVQSGIPLSLDASIKSATSSCSCSTNIFLTEYPSMSILREGTLSNLAASCCQARMLNVTFGTFSKTADW